MIIRKWSRGQGWTAITVAAFCALLLLVLVVTSALDTGRGLWAALLLFLLGALATVTALVTAPDAPVEARHYSAWLQPRPIGWIFVALFIGFGTMTNALALLSPRPAVESEPGAIEEAIAEIRTAVTPAAEEAPRIRRALPGVWGEPGCEVTYRFVIRDHALVVDSLRRPPGTEPHHLVATIVSAETDRIHVTGERPEAARGRAASFTYHTNGVVERLTWDDETSPVPLELDRCG